MVGQKKASIARLAGSFALLTLISACGAGQEVNNLPAPGTGSETFVDNTLPVAGQALPPEAAQPVAQVETAPLAPAPIDSESTPSPVPTTSEPTSEPPPTEFEPEPEPEPEPMPEPQPLPTEPQLEPEPTLPVPTNVGCTAPSQDIRSSALSLFNQARATARSCGDTPFEAAPALVWNDKLEAAALAHSEDMAVHNFFSHTGSDGLSVSQRVDAQQYNWRSVGENIAAGQPTTESALNAWLDSSGHCKNIMNPKFTEMSVQCVENNASQYRQYWTNVLATSF